MNQVKTGADVRAEQVQMTKIVERLAAEMKLRVWAVEKVVALCASEHSTISDASVQKLSEFFYEFVTRAGREEHGGDHAQ